MENLKQLLEDILNEKLTMIRISNSKNKDLVKKIEIKPVLIKETILFQESRYINTKIYHKNYVKDEMIKEVIRTMTEECKQLEADTLNQTSTVLVSKKGKVTIKKKKKTGGEACKVQDLSHNRQKKYILDPNKPIPFLKDLGVQTKDGKIVKGKYSKFRQINRYLEFVEDILPRLKEIDKKELTIIDFGCGKSYLTFALYYYLHELNGMPVKMIGLDLKEDVIKHCSLLAKQYHYDNLEFIHGDIAEFDKENEVDMVVTLHACDTATDFALAKAIYWNAKVIFSVPCCQHEVNGQITSEEWEPLFKYGLLKERMSALITDGIRANILEEQGYETQVMEFIDTDHTPKNILIRGVKVNKEDKRKVTNEEVEKKTSYRELVDALSLTPTLMKLTQDL